jgi:Asp-tRNA(Asn)/Glu-tRNA(Gln) amidotransferase A subunit family amidase
VSAGWSGSSRPAGESAVPLIGEAWAGGVINGAVTRTVRDAAGVIDVISRRMPGEPYYAPSLPSPLVREVGADPGRLRIGVLDRPDAEGFVDDPQCRAAVAGAARLVESLGHHVEQSAPAAKFEPEFTGTSTRSSRPTPKRHSRPSSGSLGTRSEMRRSSRATPHIGEPAGRSAPWPTGAAGCGWGCGRAVWRADGTTMTYWYADPGCAPARAGLVHQQ